MTPGAPGASVPVASDEIDGVPYERVKVALGPSGVYSEDLHAGQRPMAASLPVAIASDQSPVPVSLASLPLPNAAATEAGLGTDGANPPPLIGTGIRGWLRAVYERLGGTLLVDGSGHTQPVSGTVGVAGTVPVSAAALPLPAGAGTEATLAAIKADVDKIPTSPATDRTAAAAPSAVRLTDGAAFYKATAPTDTQPVSAASLPLPAGAAGEHVTAASPHAARLTDGAAFYKPTTPADTQPVSAASLPLPAGAASGAKQDTGNTSLGSLDTKVGEVQATPTANTLLGRLKDLLTGISLAASAATIGKVDQGAAGAAAWKVDGSGVTQPVSATALPLPAGAATGAKQDTGNALLGAGLPAALVGGRLDVNNGTWLGATTPTVGQKAMAASLPVALASDQGAVPVTPGATLNRLGSVRLVDSADADLTSAKGVQPARFAGVQQPKDSGRSAVMATVEAAAGAAAETLFSLVVSRAFGAVAGGATSVSVTAGKTMRIQAIVVSFVATTTTANTSRIRLRVQTVAPATLTSPLQMSWRVGWESATFIANEAECVVLPIPDGLEIPAGAGWALSHQEAAANGTIDVSVIGYEY